MFATDTELAELAIPARNEILDHYAAECHAQDEADYEFQAERRNELWFENGGALADQIAWENQQDELRAFPF
jgi:hypothetical protein